MEVIHDGIRPCDHRRPAGCGRPALGEHMQPPVRHRDGRRRQGHAGGTTMGLLDRLFGRRAGTSREESGRRQYGQPAGPQAGRTGRGEQLPDDQAIARYRYLLRTAPPEQIEQAHAEAFAQLTVDQRQQVLAQLAAAVPAGERPRTDDPETLARVATRAEMRRPGTLERALGGYGPGYGGGGYGPRGYGGGYGGGYGPGYGGPGIGSMIGGSLLGTI